MSEKDILSRPKKSIVDCLINLTLTLKKKSVILNVVAFKLFSGNFEAGVRVEAMVWFKTAVCLGNYYWKTFLVLLVRRLSLVDNLPIAIRLV